MKLLEPTKGAFIEMPWVGSQNFYSQIPYHRPRQERYNGNNNM